MIHSCDHFTDLLIDLAYGEIDADARLELEIHTRECNDCQAAFNSILLTRKMAAQLPQELPPTLTDDTIWNMARAATEEFIANPVDHRESVETNLHLDIGESTLQKKPRPFNNISRWLLRPAIATAAAASVAFVITFFIEKNSPDPYHLLETTHSDAPFLSPTNSVLSRSSSIPQSNKANSLLPNDFNSSLALESKVSESVAIASNLGTKGPSQEKTKGKLESNLPVRAKADSAHISKSIGRPPTTDNSTKASSSHKDAMTLPSRRNEAPEKQSKKAKRFSGYSEENAIDTLDDTTYMLGVNAFNRGDCFTASKFFKQVISKPTSAPAHLATSLHFLAKCDKRTGQCSRAVRYFEDLLKNYPQYSGRFEVQWEAATCYRRLGHIDRAKDLLLQLSQNPKWSTKANEELDNLKQLTD